MKFTIKEFDAQFPDDAACLAYIFNQKYPIGFICQKCTRKDSYTPIAKRRAYACICGHHISPCAGTIFHKSPTPLKSWFFAMFLMSTGKNGVSAKEIERHVGVTYKCAWRMAHQIRQLMQEDKGMLGGTVETDSTWIGGRETNKHADKRAPRHGFSAKITVSGTLEREAGKVYAKVIPDMKRKSILPHLAETVKPGSTVMTDESFVYDGIEKMGYTHHSVRHSRRQYVRDGWIHTNSIEGFWSQLKRSINGTFHQVSSQHLQKYVNEFSYRYNRRKSEMPMFAHLLSSASEQHGSAV